MELTRMTEADHPLFNHAARLYMEGFVPVERRDLPELQAVLEDPCFYCTMAVEAGQPVGIAFFWETEDFLYLEHLCVEPDRRGGGDGTRILELLKARGKTIILEIEELVDDVTRRRLAFYSRNGFFLTDHHHIQPKYRREDPALRLLILSTPRAISPEEYGAFHRFQKERVERL